MKSITEKNLAEQMGFSEREIARLLHLFDFTEDDRRHILAAAPHIEAAVDQVVEEFYKYQVSVPEIAEVIGDLGTLKRLRGTMRAYATTLFRGEYDEGYANNRLRIGKVHKRLSVSPKLYMSSILKLQSLLERAIDKAMKKNAAALAKSALHKILLFDAQMVFEAYIHGFLVEMEAARDEVDRFASTHGVKIDSISRHLQEISTKDALTGIHNRRAFYDFLSRECDLAERYRLPLTLLYMDLNGFKPINDMHGHDAGDNVLRAVAESLRAMTRAVDIPARYGGDEFCVIMPRTALEEAILPVRRMMNDFDARCEYPVTFSIGLIQTGPGPTDAPDELVKKADRLMYEAKERSKKDGNHHIAT